MRLVPDLQPCRTARAGMGRPAVAAAIVALVFSAAVAAAAPGDGAPYPPSKIVPRITWDAEVIRIGTPGNGGRDGVGDNWPITWADDGSLYTTYGDGPGFARNPKVYLTLGFAKIMGNPPAITAEDIPSDADTPAG